MADARTSQTASKTAVRTAVWLGLFLLLAFGLRAYFGAETGFDAATDRNLFTGNDPYYHFRTVGHVVSTGQNLNYDTAINYPEGNMNPNPPLWTWTTAPVAVGLSHLGVADPVGTALNIMVCVWGALIVLPVYMIGRDLWGRRAGLWGAFLIAVSAPHIQRSVWGYADHDAISMFFIVLAFAFLVKAFKTLRSERFVSSWSGAVVPGLKAAVAANRNSLAYAGLAGIALTACADTWKGYPYAVAILGVAAGLQLVVDHLRKRDALATFLTYALTTLVAALLPYLLVYHSFGNYLPHTVYPTLYVLLGLIVMGLLLVPTRDLPSLLVFPSILVAGALALAVLLLLFPATAADLFSGLGYFAQSKLYSTIAEAQRPRLGEIAANFSFFTFLIGFWGFGHAVRKAWKGDAANLFMASWAAVALYMAFAASRFISNAAPLFAILVGYAMAQLIGKLGLDDVKRKFASQHGQGLVGRSIRSVSAKSIVGVLLVAAFLVAPNVWTGVDAAMPTEYEVEHGLLKSGSGVVNRFGAFGIEFELKTNGWGPVMQTLAAQDTGMPLESKPAFIGWWDYGHWATGLGDHPTVADPFQSHYELSGRFLASDSEAEANSWLLIHLLNGDAQRNNLGLSLSAPILGLLQREAPALVNMPLGYGNYDAAYKAVRDANVTGEAVATLLEHVEATTGTSVGYLGVDRRMFPYDDPNTAGVDAPSIFYAPVFLANKNPDDYMQTQFKSGSTTITIHRYAVDAKGNSVALETPTYTDQAGNRWVEVNGYAYREGQTPRQGFSAQTGIALFGNTESMLVTSKFSDTMFAKAFGSIDARAPAGLGLAHWRLLDQSTQPSGQAGVDIRDVALLAYYSGVKVSGTVRDAAGAPLAGLQVSFADGSGARHALATTGADGAYSVLAPFAVKGDLKLQVLSAGNVVFEDNRSSLQFTQADARSGAARTGVDVVLSPATLTGHVYQDTNGNGAFDTSDTVLVGATVRAGTASASGTPGSYTLAGITPGFTTVSATLPGYANATQPLVLKSGEARTLDLAMTPMPSLTTITVQDKDGTGIGSVPVVVTGPSPTTVGTNGQGVATASLLPGSYTFSVNATAVLGGQTVPVVAHGSLTVPFGGQPMAVVLQRE